MAKAPPKQYHLAVAIGLGLIAGGAGQIRPWWAAVMLAIGITVYVNGKVWGR